MQAVPTVHKKEQRPHLGLWLSISSRQDSGELVVTGASEHRSFLLGHTGCVGWVPCPTLSAAYDFSKRLALAHLLCEPAWASQGQLTGVNEIVLPSSSFPWRIWFSDTGSTYTNLNEEAGPARGPFHQLLRARGEKQGDFTTLSLL